MTRSEALLAALTGEPDSDVDPGELAAAHRDLDRIRRGMSLLAADAAQRVVPRRVTRRAAVAAVAAVVVAAGMITVANRPGAGTKSVAPPTGSPSPGPGVSLGSGIIDHDWQARAHMATRIVVGTVTTVRHGQLTAPPPETTGGPYVLLHIAVDETLKGPPGDVDVFAYDLTGGTTLASSQLGRTWAEGQRVLLLLLAPDLQEPSASLPPAHFDLLDGDLGRYDYANGQLAAPFTLEQLRAEIAR
jgi:hypothetical protein